MGNVLRKFLPGVLALLYIVSGPKAAAQDPSFCGTVVSVSDGDTIKVMHAGIPETVRLNRIDCPEKSQPFGQSAKLYTSSLCFGRNVCVEVKAKDRYKRTVGEVYLPDGRSLNQEIVSAGYAWWYRKYSAQDPVLPLLESDARSKHTGLWADPSPVPPWEFRQARKKRKTSQFNF